MSSKPKPTKPKRASAASMDPTTKPAVAILDTLVTVELQRKAAFGARFQAFLDELFRGEYGEAKGARGIVAEKLGITREHLSRLQSGARQPSADLARRAGLAFDFDDDAYFFGLREEAGSYRDFPARSSTDARALAAKLLSSFATDGVGAVEGRALASAVLRMPVFLLAQDVAAMAPDDPGLPMAAGRLALEFMGTFRGHA